MSISEPYKNHYGEGFKKNRLWLPVAGCGLTVRCKSIR